MKVRDRLKLQIRKDLLLVLILCVCAAVSWSWFETMPKIFIFLVGGVIFISVEAILLWFKFRNANPHMDEIVATPVTVLEINERSMVLEGRSPVSWNEIDEIRKVYRAIGTVFVKCVRNPGVTRRFFYVIHLRDGQWLQLSNVSIMAFMGSLRKGLDKSPDAANLLKQLLTEAGKQAHVRLVCHNEAMARFEPLDLWKEMDDLSKWKGK